MRFILIWLTFLLPGTLSAQEHILPAHEGAGAPGPAAGSFIIAWESVPGVLGYEYVLTDNELCFSGCGGDTRQGIVSDTFVVEEGLQEGIWYYWITRIIYPSADTGRWTNISAFRAITPEAGPSLFVAPNPVPSDVFRFRADWGADPNARRLRLRLSDISGQQVGDELILARPASALRYSWHEFETRGLQAGLYFCRVFVDDNEQPTSVIRMYKI